MDDTLDDFVSQFHNLAGITIGERTKNFYKLLHFKKITPDQEQHILDNLKPDTYLQKLFQIDLLLHLRKTKKLLQILKGGNEVFASKIMKQDWFFKDVLDNVSADELVTNILPSISFSVRVKFLKKLVLVLTAEQLDKVFDAVLRRYGLFIATILITGCTPEKIEIILKNNEIKLSSRDLKKLHKKDPKLIELYMEEMNRRNNKILCDNDFLIYLAQNDPVFFWSITKKYRFDNEYKIGRRTTKKLINTGKTEIVSDPKRYLKYLRTETLIRKLNNLGDFKQFYTNLFPKSIEELDEYRSCTTILKYYPKSKRYNIFLETFNNVIGDDIWSNTSCFDDFFLELISDESIREKWARIKYQESQNIEYFKYYGINNCVALIKERINFTSSINQRSKILCILVKCCELNGNLGQLEQVLKYFYERHRNDDQAIRNAFLSSFTDFFKYEEFSEKHWKLLIDILTIHNLEGFSGGHCLLRIEYVKYLCRCQKSDETVKEAIKEFVKDQVLDFYNVLDNRISKIKNHEIEKKVLLCGFDYLPLAIKTAKMDHEETYIQGQFISAIFEYNIRYPEHKIIVSEHETMKDVIRAIFSKDPYFRCYLQKSCIKEFCKSDRNDFENEMIDSLWKWAQSDVSFGQSVFKWSLKHDPMVMANKFDVKMTMPCRFWHKIKLYSHLGLDKKVKTNCISQLSCEECYTKSDLILPISVLSTSEEYFKIMEEANCFPTAAKVAIEDKQISELFKLQKMFISNLKNTKEPVQYLPVLMDKFLLGDYLQSSLPSLYSAFSHSPEISLENYIDKLLKNKHVSVQKHALFLACRVLDHENVVRLMRYFKDKENEGIGKFLFLSSLKYFSKNPSDDIFNLVKTFMTFLKEQDIESMKVSTTTNIANNFKPSYVQSLWKVLESFENNTEINKIKSEYLESLDEICIRKLSLNFCEDIIHNYFLKQKGEKDSDIPGINSFVTKFLINYNDTPHKFALVFNIIQNFKAEFWSKSKILERKKIYTFFNAFYKEACDKKVRAEIIAEFSNCWNNLFTPVDTFEEYVLLNMLQYRTESSPENCAKKIVEFSENIVEKFGQIVFPKFAATLAKSFTFKDEERINLLYEILKIKTSNLNCILVIKLIETKGDLFHNDKITKKYLKIDNILKESCDSNIQLFRNLYLKNVD